MIHIGCVALHGKIADKMARIAVHRHDVRYKHGTLRTAVGIKFQERT